MNKTLTVRLPKGLRDDLDKVSKDESTPVSDIVRESVAKYLSIYKFKKLRKKAVSYAEKTGFITDEDVFIKIS